MDDITDMRRSCRLRENTSGRRPLGSSSRLLKVPNVSVAPHLPPSQVRPPKSRLFRSQSTDSERKQKNTQNTNIV